MGKFLEKIRTSIFGERHVTEKGNLILKNKKLTDTEKMAEIFNLYSKYLNSNQYDADVTMETYEIHYEGFMVDDERHPLRYATIKNEVAKDQRFLICTQIVRQISLLKNIDKTLCDKKQLELLEIITSFANKVYTPSLNYSNFYTNRETREKLNNLNQELEDKIKSLTAEKVNNTMDNIFEL